MPKSVLVEATLFKRGETNMSKPLIALVEPSFYGLGYVEAAQQLGCNFVAIVSDRNNPKKYNYEGKYYDLIEADIRDVTSVINAIESSPYKEKFNAIISATDYATHIIAKVAEHFGLPHTPYSAALAARHKDLARDIYKKCQVPSAKYRKVQNVDEALSAAQDIGYPVVLKPTNCVSSQNVSFVQNDDELRQKMLALKDFQETYLHFRTSGEYLIEEYLDGPEFSAELLLRDGELAFASVTEKLTTDLPYFAEMAHVVPTSTCQESVPNIIDVAFRAAKALGFGFGPLHVELKLTQRGPVIVETNGRSGGDQISTDLLIHAFGMNMFVEAIKCFLDYPFDFQVENQRAAAIAYLGADREGEVESVDGIDAIRQATGIVKANFTFQIGDMVRPPHDSGDRLGYVIAVADSPNEAKQCALDAISTIRLQYKINNLGNLRVPSS